MAYSFISSNSSLGNTSSLTLTKPTGVQEGDIIVVSILHDISYVNSVPTGFTNMGQNKYDITYYEIFYKIAGASEPTSYSFGYSASQRTSGVILAYRGGFDSSDPVDVVSNTLYNTFNKDIQAASMTVTTKDSLVIFFGNMRNSDNNTLVTSPSGFTDRHFGGDRIADMWQYVGDMLATAGATGTKTVSFSDSTATKHAFMVAFNPPTETVNTTNFFRMF